jgi:hypothetical protein
MKNDKPRSMHHASRSSSPEIGFLNPVDITGSHKYVLKAGKLEG